MSAAGFADPVLQSQATFRAILKAMSRPGTIVAAGAELAPPAPLSPAAAAALLTLADYETSLWLSPSIQGTEVGAWLKFHSDAPTAPNAAAAAFALIDLGCDGLRLEDFAVGTPAYPDRSTTLVIACAALSEDGPLTLRGPGVRGASRFGFSPLPADFLAQWSANGERFPLGVDLVLTCGTSLAALPRTTRLIGDA
jgi:alpha-D-ribose 1-methylphosphonate 5-triphosphate synthase subunit PhnH